MKTTNQFNGDGSYTFLQNINGTKHTLDKYSNYTVWAPYNAIIVNAVKFLNFKKSSYRFA